MGHDLSEVCGEGVVVVAGCGLAGFAKSTAVIGDDAVAPLQECGHLFLPGSAAERIAVNQDDGVTGTMIFVIELDVTGVFFSDLYKWHGLASSSFPFGCAKITGCSIPATTECE